MYKIRLNPRVPQVRLWNTETSAVFPWDNRTVFRGDRTDALTFGARWEAVVHDAVTGEPKFSLRGHRERLLSARYSKRYITTASIDETARVLGVSSGTVDNDWFAAKAWLARELRDEPAP